METEQKKEPNRYCLDIETLCTRADAVIFEIGCVKFGRRGILARYQAEVDIADCVLRGMKIGGDTAEWWAKQSEAAREALERCQTNRGLNLDAALMALKGFFDDHGTPDEVWGNGPAFDNRLLDEAFARCGMKLPWSYRADRCLRTAKHYLPPVKVAFAGVKHRALDDAEHEAWEIMGMEAAQRAKESELRSMIPPGFPVPRGQTAGEVYGGPTSEVVGSFIPFDAEGGA